MCRKFQNIFENPRVFKTFIRKCCSVSVPLDTSKVFLTTLPKTFMQIHRFFLSKSKKDEKPIVQQFFWHYSCVHSDYCFNTPDYFFAKIRKNSFKVPKEMIIVKITLISFSQSIAEDTWNALYQPAKIFLPKYGYFRSGSKNDQRITLLSKRASKRSAVPVGCSFENFDKKFTAKGPYFCSTTKNLEQSFFMRKKRPKIVPLKTLNRVLTILRLFFD